MKPTKTRIFALTLALIMTLALAACGNSNTPSGGNTNPPTSSQGGNSTTPTPSNTPDQSQAGTSDPSPSGGENSTPTPTDNNGGYKSPYTEESLGEGMTLDEYIDSIFAELKLDGVAETYALSYLNELLGYVDGTCSRYNCPPSEIEAHKKDAVTSYFDGVAELLKTGDTLAANRDWQRRQTDADKASVNAHKGE